MGLWAYEAGFEAAWLLPSLRPCASVSIHSSSPHESSCTGRARLRRSLISSVDWATRRSGRRRLSPWRMRGGGTCALKKRDAVARQAQHDQCGDWASCAAGPPPRFAKVSSRPSRPVHRKQARWGRLIKVQMQRWGRAQAPLLPAPFSAPSDNPAGRNHALSSLDQVESFGAPFDHVAIGTIRGGGSYRCMPSASFLGCKLTGL